MRLEKETAINQRWLAKAIVWNLSNQQTFSEGSIYCTNLCW